MCFSVFINHIFTLLNLRITRIPKSSPGKSQIEIRVIQKYDQGHKKDMREGPVATLTCNRARNSGGTQTPLIEFYGTQEKLLVWRTVK